MAVALTFTQFEVGWFDTVSVFDGACTVALEPDSLSGSKGVNQTYQSRAASLSVRLSSQFNFGTKHGFTAVYRAVPASASAPLYVQQEAALLALYRSTHGPIWKHNWEEHIRNNCTMCAWYGVTCDAAQRVTRLNLEYNNMNGTIPEAISDLRELTYLNLARNYLELSIPESLYKLRKLVFLSLLSNDLGGTISEAVSDLNQLTHLNLGYNTLGLKLQSTIPESLYTMGSLVLLDLSFNAITGTISEAVQGLNQLTSLNLGANRLRGTIPESLYTLSKLRRLGLHKTIYLTGVGLTGTISEAIEGLNQLSFLFLDSNQLHGALPESLYKLRKLVKLNLDVNDLSGTISEAVQQLTALAGLDLNSNLLNGSIPEAVASLNQLTYLNLAFNLLQSSIPESLYTMRKLRFLGLSDNHLDGTISEAVQHLTGLTSLDLQFNQLHGTIPESVYTMRKLKSLLLVANTLNGTISEAVQQLNALTRLDLGLNQLHGPIPASLCNCSKLKHIVLYRNLLSGSLHKCLGTLTSLRRLVLRENTLSGSIPHFQHDQHFLDILDLCTNRLDGTVPSMLPSNLGFLGLANNSFHGTLSHVLASLADLKVLLLSNNSFEGSLPKLNSSFLEWALFDRNRFSGLVPWESLLQTELAVLSLASNQLSGSIASQLPSSLSQLLLDNNHFSGPLPSFEALSALQTLTVHENQCHGQLHLPQNASSLRVVFAHNNLGLSCPIQVGSDTNDTYLQEHNLVLAGNRFSSPVPSWVAMRDANSMYVFSELNQWKERIGYVVVGLPLLFCCLLGVYGKSVLEFFTFKPALGLARFQWWSAKAIGMMGVAFLVVMLPLYGVGANLYECGETWLKTTSIAYLSDSPMVEWFVAIMACVATVTQSWLLRATRHEAEINFPPSRKISLEEMPRADYVKIAVMWLVVLFFLSLPTILYALSTTLPTDNTLGLGEMTLWIFHQAAAILLYLIIVMAAPYTAEWVVKKATRKAEADAVITTRLVLVARLAIVVVVPTVIAVLFSNECLSFWLDLWTPCVDDASRFDVRVQLKPGLDYVRHAKYGEFSKIGFLSDFEYPYAVTTHAQICNPHWESRMCSRAVFSTLGNLILSKATLDAFLVPGAVMLMSMPFVTRPAERIWKKLCPEQEFCWYRADVELSYILMFFEHALIFGFIMPLILPLIAVGLMMNCAVYRCAVETLKLPTHEGVQPPFQYLQVARMFQGGFLMWFFIENDLHGQWLVCIGVPVSAIVGDLIAKCVWSESSLQATNAFPAELQKPLIERDSLGQVTEMTDDHLLNNSELDMEVIGRF